MKKLYFKHRLLNNNNNNLFNTKYVSSLFIFSTSLCSGHKINIMGVN